MRLRRTVRIDRLGLPSYSEAKSESILQSFGYDPYAPIVARATQSARVAGIADRVSFSTSMAFMFPADLMASSAFTSPSITQPTLLDYLPPRRGPAF